MRICLVVDNPLRDLDGLVLVAFQLARKGVDVWLIPMYEQAFDVFSVMPDWVVSNYVRPNNINHLRMYKKADIQVAILDTEGASGATADEFAKIVVETGGFDSIDKYFVWGTARYLALGALNVVDPNVLSLTGCPRYDYCAPPWRDVIDGAVQERDFVLINTNFPVVNPRFASDSDSEKTSLVKAGYTASFAEAYVREARVAQAGMIELVARLLVAFPNQRFVLRPHPFESTEPYRQLSSHDNFEIRQEGTSVEWVSKARALIHLTCSTAVEAVMLGLEPVSPAWLETPTLRVSGPHAVSRHPGTFDEFVYLLREILSGELSADDFLGKKRADVISDVYYQIDGKAAERIAIDLLNGASKGIARGRANPSFKARVIRRLQKFLGYRFYRFLRKLFDSELDDKRQLKRISLSEVQVLLNKLASVSGVKDNIFASSVSAGSGQAIHIGISSQTLSEK